MGILFDLVKDVSLIEISMFCQGVMILTSACMLGDIK